MAAGQGADLFDAYFRRADLDRDGRITGAEAVAFFQGANLPKQVLAQIWTYADQHKTGFLGRNEFYNALKLITVAQSKRDLTPDIVKAALFGPASNKIPPPNINLAATPSPPPPNPAAVPPVEPPAAATPIAPRGPANLNMGQQFYPNQTNQMGRPPRPSPPVGLPNQVNQLAPRGVTQLTAQDGLFMSQIRPQVGTVQIPTIKNNELNLPSPQVPGSKNSKSLSVSGNGFSSDSIFGDGFSVNAPPPKQNVIVSATPAAQTTARPNLPVFNQQLGNQNSQAQPIIRGNQQIPVQNFSAAGNSAAGLSQVSWPRMTPTDIQKYNKVFVEVDSDRDGKITGEQARNLFLSWRLPREILKQVWDLSDQDNDSMLSFREFCIALYLMERFREGRPLPKILPNNILIDEAMAASGQQAAAYGGNTSWRPPTSGVQHQQVTHAARPPIPRPRPQNQVSLPLPDEAIPQPAPQKSQVPVLEKHLVNQLSEQEQNSLNTKFNEATEANKKVEELEKEIVDSRKKIEFFRTKMQELILYKSRCDNRLNEITERTSMDKREVESLAKKYEEKYKQSGDVASKLSIEEATFRDIQEKKMDLYRSIVKMDQDGKPDSIKVNADKIQTELEELMKSVNERCKTYGLRAKPTTLVELPFGWQPGIQEGAADWDEDWDKFEDEGFTFVKDLTLDVKNIIAPPKTKSLQVKSKASTAEDGVKGVSVANGDLKSENIKDGEEQNNGDTHSEDGVAKSPPESTSEKSQIDSSKKEFNADGSPHAKETQSEHGDKSSDELGIGAFDNGYDTHVWNFGSAKEFDIGTSFYDSGDLGLPPIRTDSSHKEQKNTFVFDSVPSTPQTDNIFQNKSYTFDSVPSTPQADNLFAERSTYTFDSVPSTPQSDNFFQKKSAFSFDSIPNTPQADSLFQQRSAFNFDSVPSTPVYNYNSNSPRRLSEDSEINKFDSFSRFDSFNTQDGGLFPSRDSLSRFDSFSSTRESDYGQGFSSQDAFSRFDSFRSTTNDSGQDAFSKFDSFKSTTRDSGQDAFSRFDSFRSTTKDSDSGFFPSRDYGRFDSFSSNKDGDDGHNFNTFDDSDPFGSSGPFKTSFDSQTPRKDSDDWKAF